MLVCEPGAGTPSDRAVSRAAPTTAPMRTSTGRAERAGWQRPAGDLRLHARLELDAREHRVEQPLPDAPAPEAVELDRQRVVDLVLVSLTQIPRRWRRSARAGCSTNETSCSSSTSSSPAAAAAPAGTARGARAAPMNASARRAPAGRSSTGGRARAGSGREVARVERLQRMADDDLLARRALARRGPCASITSSSSPTGTAGGSGALVRSSLPL